MTKLTDTQLVNLTNAARRGDGAVLPLPNSLKANKGTLTTSLKSLLQRRLIAERQAKPGDDVWRETESGERYTLVVADAGLKSIGVELAEEGAADTRKQNIPEASTRTNSKQSILIDLLQRADGASLDELILALDWQAHSIRGAIAGAIKKRLGFTVLSEKHPERGRVYRIEETNIVAGRQ